MCQDNLPGSSTPRTDLISNHATFMDQYGEYIFMSDAFLLGAGFSKAICNKMPTMNELYELLEPLIDKADGFTREAYEYASGDAEALLSYYA